MTVAQVATDVAAGRTFDYEVPPGLEAAAVPGAMVRVPFGTRVLDGLVLGVSDATAWPKPLRKVIGAAPGEPPLTPQLVELAGWMARYYLAPIELCLRSMLPPVVRDGVEKDAFARALVVRAAPGADARAAEATERQREILARLAGGEELLAGFCRAWRVSPQTIRAMQARGLVEVEEKDEEVVEV